MTRTSVTGDWQSKTEHTHTHTKLAPSGVQAAIMASSSSILYYYYTDVASVIEEHFAKALSAAGTTSPYEKSKGMSLSPGLLCRLPTHT